MSCSESRAEVIKPLIIKASKIATLSISAYIFAKFITKRSDSILEPSSTQSQKNPQENEAIDDSESFHRFNLTPLDDEVCKDECNLENKLLELESQLADLQSKELSMESRYLRYRAMKEKEMMLMKIRNELLLEKSRAELLLKEICLAEEHNKIVGSLVITFIKLCCNFRASKEENVLLQRNVRKLCKRGEHRLMIIWKQKRLIESKDEELKENEREIERMDGFIQEIEDENKELKEILNHLQREKIELTNKVDLVESLYASNTKIEITESVAKDEYDKALKELGQLKKDMETEANEITYLKWSNACLRHELLKYHEQQEQDKDDSDNRIVVSEFQDHEYGNYDTNNSHNVTSKRRRFINKIKKWVDGGQIDDKDKHEIKCFRKKSVSGEAGDTFVHARMSCSSV